MRSMVEGADDTLRRLELAPSTASRAPSPEGGGSVTASPHRLDSALRMSIRSRRARSAAARSSPSCWAAMAA